METSEYYGSVSRNCATNRSEVAGQLVYCPDVLDPVAACGTQGGAELVLIFCVCLAQLWSARLAAVLRGLLRVNPAAPATRFAGTQAARQADGRARSLAGWLAPFVGRQGSRQGASRVGRAGRVARWLAVGTPARSTLQEARSFDPPVLHQSGPHGS